MFAVIPPKPAKPDRFIIKTDKKDTGTENKQTSNAKDSKQENTAKNNLENKSSINNNSNKTEQQSLKANLTENYMKDENRKPKIRLSIIKDPPFCFRNVNDHNKNIDKKQNKKMKELKIKQKKMNKDGNFNCGRWTQDEHVRFIEAIMKYGNEWKQVQRHVGTRSSTQARSHAQKFFVKIKKSNALDLESMNLSKNSIKTLHELALNMNSDEYFNAIKILNCVAFEKKNFKKRKNKKGESQMLDSSNACEDPQSIIHLNCVEEHFTFSANDKSLLNPNTLTADTHRYRKNSNLNPFDFKSNEYELICEEKSPMRLRSDKHIGQNTQNSNKTIIINNKINNFHYNLNINNTNNYNYYNNNQNETYTRSKRNRFNSFEELLNFFPDLRESFTNLNNNYRNFVDEKEYENNFECAFKNVKNDLDCDNDLIEEMLILTRGEEKPSRKQTRSYNLKNEMLYSDEEMLINFEKD